MDRYRIEYAEKGVPGLLYKNAIGAEELLEVLLGLKYFGKLKSFDDVKIYSKKHWKKLDILSSLLYNIKWRWGINPFR